MGQIRDCCGGVRFGSNTGLLWWLLLWVKHGIVVEASFMDQTWDCYEGVCYGSNKGLSWRDRKSTRLNSSHSAKSRMPSSA